MMDGKFLGKITFAEFGMIADYPFLMGLKLGFKLGDGGSVMDGGKYTVNINPNCKWDKRERADAIVEILEFVEKTLKDAQVNDVSKLINKPVEVTIEKNTFKDFRILTEVL